MSQIIMYTSQHCPFCRMAEQLLARLGKTPRKIRVDVDTNAYKTMIERTGRKTVPQIFINDYHVGGYDDLAAFDNSGRLSKLIADCR